MKISILLGLSLGLALNGHAIERDKEIIEMEFVPFQNIEVMDQNIEVMEHEVTQAMYFDIIGKNPSHFSNEAYCKGSFLLKVSPLTNESVGLCPNHPVENVTYSEVMEFIQKLNETKGWKTRLPSLREWERFARANYANQKSQYFFGDKIELLGLYAIYEDNSQNQTQPVARARSHSNRPNLIGLYDLHGNVFELTQDRFSLPEPFSSEHYYIVKGGSWNSPPEHLQVSGLNYQSSQRDLYGSSQVGFRLVREN